MFSRKVGSSSSPSYAYISTSASLSGCYFSVIVFSFVLETSVGGLSMVESGAGGRAITGMASAIGAYESAI